MGQFGLRMFFLLYNSKFYEELFSLFNIHSSSYFYVGYFFLEIFVNYKKRKRKTDRKLELEVSAKISFVYGYYAGLDAELVSLTKKFFLLFVLGRE